MVLANLEQLQIRALFSQLSSSVSLRRVVLEIATDTATGTRASNVELCFCPANYQGDSCQVRVKADVLLQAEGSQTATFWVSATPCAWCRWQPWALDVCAKQWCQSTSFQASPEGFS